ELDEDRVEQAHDAAQRDAEDRRQPRVHAVLHEQRGDDQAQPEHRADGQVDLAHGDQEGHARGDDPDVGRVLDDLLQLAPRQEIGVGDADDDDQRDRRDQDAVGFHLEYAARDAAPALIDRFARHALLAVEVSNIYHI